MALFSTIRFLPPPLLLSICLSFFITFAAASSSANLSIYDVLRAHGLPMGLLPKGVKEFDIDKEGRFWVHLDQACNAKFESELHFEQNVTGTLSCGRMGALSGITAQELFLWFPVKGIRVDIPSSGLIYFDVGVVRKQFSLSLFETPPDCLAAPSREADGFSDGLIMAESVSKVHSWWTQFKAEGLSKFCRLVYILMWVSLYMDTFSEKQIKILYSGIFISIFSFSVASIIQDYYCVDGNLPTGIFIMLAALGLKMLRFMQIFIIACLFFFTLKNPLLVI